MMFASHRLCKSSALAQRNGRAGTVVTDESVVFKRVLCGHILMR